MKLKLFIFSLFSVIWLQSSFAQNNMKSTQTKAVFESDFALNYLQYLPENYSADNPEKYPMILFLHGSGERGNNLEKVKAWGPPKIADEKGLPFVVISPQCPEGIWWNAILESLRQLLDNRIENLNVDTSRIYITGLSMGGFGTFAMAQMYPDYFAAMAPICGGGTPLLSKFSQSIPAWVFHGEADPVVPLSSSVAMVEAMKLMGNEVKFTVYEGVGHAAWIPAYNESGIFDWLLQHKKTRAQNN